MQVSDQKVVTLNYVLKDDEGNTMDASQDGTFSYLHGAQNIIPGLENALTGKQPGDTFSVAIPAAEAYGERDPGRIQAVPREMFPADIDIQPGMQFQAQGPEGQTMMVTVAEVREDVVVVDGNHPLAGVALNFEVEVVDVRDATAEELAHGHVHG
ncbi:MAG TPA: peptidylprolyl isomerase [Thiotrichales bacterium]|nr:peptidylprolyl isomerase [Thiotrichales bacterium]